MLHNQILSNKKTKKKLPWILISFGLFALFCIVSVFVYYKYIFFDFKIDSNVEHFGQFGDFIGGTLNPILAFLSFMALLYTIKIQTDELKLSREELEATREELKGSRIAQQEQSESLKLQNEATKLQIFENTFFNLIDIYLRIKSDVSFYVSGRNETKYGTSAISNLLDTYKREYLLIDSVFLYKYENNFGTYFNIIFRIFEYIDKSKIDNSKQYVKIFCTQFTNDELEFLLYYCQSEIKGKDYKKFVEDYEFFEHIILNKDIQKQLLEYDKKAFGKNEEILEKYNELKESKQ